MTTDPEANSVKEVGRMPLGLRRAVVFLQLVIVVFLFPCVGLALVTLVGIVTGGVAKDPFPEAVVVNLGLVVAVVVLAAIVTGAMWLTKHLESSAGGTIAGHPGRMICLPAVGLVVVCGLLAVLIWVPSLFINDVARTFPWPLIWGSLGGGALLLYRHLDKTLPR